MRNSSDSAVENHAVEIEVLASMRLRRKGQVILTFFRLTIFTKSGRGLTIRQLTPGLKLPERWRLFNS